MIGMFEKIFKDLEDKEEKHQIEIEKAKIAMAYQQQALLAQQQAQNSAYQQSAGVLGALGSNAIGIINTGNTGGHWVNTTTGGGSFVSGQPLPGQPFLPAPTGLMISVAFVDAKGVVCPMEIDQAYFHIISQISNIHHMNSGMRTQQMPQHITLKKPQMLEGDFSEDEMELAEEIIDQLNGKEKEVHAA